MKKTTTTTMMTTTITATMISMTTITVNYYSARITVFYPRPEILLTFLSSHRQLLDYIGSGGAMSSAKAEAPQPTTEMAKHKIYLKQG